MKRPQLQIFSQGKNAPAVDTVLPSNRQQLLDGLSQAILLLPEVVIKHSGRAWVGEDVCIALGEVVGGEGPVIERGTGVMVVDEGDGAGRPHAQQAWGTALGIYQPPVLTAAHSFLHRKA